MDMESEIDRILRQSMNVTILEIVNQSHLHKGHAGDDGSGQTHYKLKVVSPDFEGLSRVAQQRLVMKCLDACFASGLHAVQISCETK